MMRGSREEAVMKLSIASAGRAGEDERERAFEELRVKKPMDQQTNKPSLAHTNQSISQISQA
jgi:hypothetical protein